MRLTFLFLSLAFSALAAAADLTITADREDGCYAVGETVTWTVSNGTSDGSPAYTVKSGGLTKIAEGQLSFIDGKATVTAKLDRPGTLLLTVKVDEKKKVLGGAAVAWSEIKPAADEPADFDAFWKEKLMSLAAIPANPVLEEVASGAPEVQLWKITMDHIDGSKIQGYLARPRGMAPAPAMLQLQHAGTLGLRKEWVTGPAKQGWLALNILAHDLPVDRDDAFYQEQFSGSLQNYTGRGNEDRDKSYWLRIYLSCYRAADYLNGRSDWNKKSLLVQGGSMGGMQSLVAAGIHPAVTCVTVDVPAGCDMKGSSAGRAVGFPWWVNNAASFKSAGYYDVASFAKRIRCPVLVGMGLLDTISPAEGVFAMYNQISSPKRLVIMPTTEHMGNHAAYDAVRNQWWKAAATGEPFPLK